MGTSGLRIIKFRGRYWVFHNYYHSYLEGMGDSLVHSIPSDPERYQQWLQSQRCLYAKWDDLLQRILCIEPDHLLKIESDTTLVGFLAEAFDERLSVIPSYVAESLSWNWPVAFTYTLDLDLEVFTIDNTAHYRLDKVPKSKDWIRALCVDDNRRRFIHPRLAPEESLASLVVKNAEFHLTDKEYWESLTSKLVKPKSARSTSAMVRLSLFRIFAECQFDTLSVSLLSWTTKDLPFREIVFFIICLATGGSHLALVDERQFVYSRSAAPSFAALLSIDGEKELISPLGVGFHMHNQPIGSAPDASKYWFEGALVCLVPQLEDPDVALKAMGDAIRYGRGECKRTSFNAVLISIAHVIFLRSLPDGGIEYSHSMSLMNTDDFFGMSARERYQEGWLDEVYEGKMARRSKREAAKKAAAEKEAAEKGAAEKEAAEKEAAEKEAAEKGAAENEATRIAATDSNSAVKGETSDSGYSASDHDKVNPHHPLIDGKADVSLLAEQIAEGGQHADVMAGIDITSLNLDGKEEHKGSKDLDAVTSNGAIPTLEKNVQSDAPCNVEAVTPGGKLKAKSFKEATGSKHEGTGQSQDDKEEKTGEAEFEWTTADTFMALAHFFEATIRENLRPTYDNGCKLPVELVETILGYISDTKTYDACTRVSRTFRDLCHKRSVNMDGVAICELPPNERNLTSEDTESSKVSTTQSQFQAEELSSGRRMRIKFESKLRYSGKSNFRVVIGSERNRKLFCPDCPFMIRGLELPAPFDIDPRIADTDSVIPAWKDPSEPTDTAWGQAFRRERVTANSDTTTLGRFWAHLALELFEDDMCELVFHRLLLEPLIIQDWLMPPNTRQYSISTNTIREEEFQQLLYMRIKRSSKYWGTLLWDDIIQETTELLDSIDDGGHSKRMGKVQKVGTGNPLVILVVGLEVRLFEWKEASPETAEMHGTLEPLCQGTLSITDVKHRKWIEVVLQLAVARLKAMKRKEEPS